MAALEAEGFACSTDPAVPGSAFASLSRVDLKEMRFNLRQVATVMAAQLGGLALQSDSLIMPSTRFGYCMARMWLGTVHPSHMRVQRIPLHIHASSYTAHVHACVAAACAHAAPKPLACSAHTLAPSCKQIYSSCACACAAVAASVAAGAAPATTGPTGGSEWAVWQWLVGACRAAAV